MHGCERAAFSSLAFGCHEAKLVFRQIYMDFSICAGSSYNSDGLKTLLIIYDVCCQWCKRFLDRLAANNTISLPASIPHDGITYAVGKFHLAAHIKECYPLYTLNYMLGAGQLDGELMETVWSPMKHIAASTRSMSLAYRMEALNYLFLHHNWKKLISCGMILILLVSTFCN